MGQVRKKAVVAGGLGLIGRNMVEHLVNDGSWDVVALSRRPPERDLGARFVSLDLLDRAEVEAQAELLSDASLLFYAAWQPRPTSAEEVAPNLAMLRNLLEVTGSVSPQLDHVSFMQGSKVYGAHIAPYRTPARETDPRHMPPNFYYDQEDYVRTSQNGKSWHYSILRPNSPCGFAVGNPMNLMMVIAVYAAISRELGLPLRFPGSDATYRMLYEVTDMALLAKAATWAATSNIARNEIYNVSNGDYFRWENLWPRIADFFEMDVAPPQAIKLTERMADKADIWQSITEKYDLQLHAYESIVSWGYADGRFNRGWETLMDTNKLRRHGFMEFVDSEEMFMRIFHDLRRDSVIP